MWSFPRLQFYLDRSNSGPDVVDLRVVGCRKCFALYQNPVPTEVGFARLFEHAGASYGSRDGRQAEQVSWALSHGLVVDGTKVLDVGCYDGRFLSQFPPGITRIGVDVDEGALQAARSSDPEGTYLCSSFENLDLPPVENVGLVTMIHLIEHVPDPVSLLKKIRDVSTDKTYLMIETPVLENARPGDAVGFFSNQHLTHFSRNSLLALVAKSGWKVLEIFEAPDYNGTRLICVPGASAMDAHSTYADVANCFRYLSKWTESISRISERLSEVSDAEQIIVWGAGMHTETLFALGLFRNLDQISWIVDTDEKKIDGHWRGIPIRSASSLQEISWEDKRMVVSSYGSQLEIIQQALSLGIPREKLVALYDRIHSY